LYLKWKKCQLYAKEIECLGHMIDDNGIHMDTDKMDKIRNWKTPRNYNEVQRFVGMVNYISNFLPNVTTYTGPLMSMTKNRAPFFWRPIHEKCFQMIKTICCKTPVIKPVDYESREVSKGQGVEPKTNGKTTPPTDSIQAMGFHQNGLHRTIPRSEWSKLPLGNYMLADEHGPPDNHSHEYNGEGTVMEIFEGSGPVTWTTEFDSE